MNIDLFEAVKAPFLNKPNWGKYLLGGLLIMIPIVNIFVGIALTGAMMKYIRSVQNKTDINVDIFENWKESFSIGSKAVVGGIILALPVLILIYIAMMFIPLSSSFDSFQIGIPLIVFSCTVVQLFLFFFMPALYLNFSLDYKIKSMIDFERAIFLVKGNLRKYLKLLLFGGLLGILYSIFMSVPVINLAVILILYIPYVITINNLMGQFLRDNKSVAVIKNIYKLN